MKIDFYYWNFQCPISYETLNLLKEYKHLCEIHPHDISIHGDKAKQNKIFFPFLTVFNDNIHYRSPLKRSIIDKFLKGEDLVEKPYMANQSEIKFKGLLKI